MKTKKQGNNWTAYYDPDTKRYFAEIIYTSREGREQYDYEITQDIYARLGTFFGKHNVWHPRSRKNGLGRRSQQRDAGDCE